MFLQTLHKFPEYLPLGFSPDWKGVIYIFLVCWILWGIASSVYTWWRLRQVPNVSIVAPFSHLWLARNAYSGRQYWRYRDLHDKLGPLIRIGPNEVLTDDPVIIRNISSTRSQYSRSSWYKTGRFDPYHDNLFTMLEPAAHTKAKARSSAAYNGRETPDLEASVDEQVVCLLNVLRTRYLAASPTHAQPLLDLGLMTCFFTMDVITRLGFGEAVGYMRDNTDHYGFLGLVRKLWPRMSTSADVPWIRDFLFSPLMLKVLGPKVTDKTGFGALMGVAERHVNRRFTESTPRKRDLLDSLIDRGFTKRECQAESLMLLLAGTESTACAIRSIIVHIISSPTAYRSLKEEIRAAVQEQDLTYPISVKQAKSLSYLQAVLYEGIRMRPPLLGLFPKIVPPDQCPVFHGLRLPAGTAVCVNTSALLCAPALFGADARVFRPERFIEAGERRAEMERNVDLAFGHGQWICAGKGIAMMEMAKFVFEVFRVFDMQLLDPLAPCEVESYGVFLEKGLMVKLSVDRDTSI